VFPSSSRSCEPLRPRAVVWALQIEALDAVVVVEPGYPPDSPPVVHLARQIIIPGSVDRLLKDAHWRARTWLARPFGAVARCDRLDGGKATP
jgi:hypothetical protein